MTEAVATVALALPDQDRDSLPTIRTRCREIFDRRDALIGTGGRPRSPRV